MSSIPHKEITESLTGPLGGLVLKSHYYFLPADKRQRNTTQDLFRKFRVIYCARIIINYDAEKTQTISERIQHFFHSKLNSFFLHKFKLDLKMELLEINSLMDQSILKWFIFDFEDIFLLFLVQTVHSSLALFCFLTKN
jgi:hypothetical protein